MLIDKIRQAYPDPQASCVTMVITGDEYCVLGACLKFAVDHGVLHSSFYVNFPSVEWLCEVIWPDADKSLLTWAATDIARLNDTEHFEEAWEYLDSLLNNLLSNTLLIDVLKGDE